MNAPKACVLSQLSKATPIFPDINAPYANLDAYKRFNNRFVFLLGHRTRLVCDVMDAVRNGILVFI